MLVNGFPLVHIELKRRGVPIREAFNQINRYQRDSFGAGSGLYEYVQIFVISNGTNTKYYSNTTRKNVENSNDKKRNKSKTSNTLSLLLFGQMPIIRSFLTLWTSQRPFLQSILY